MEINTDGERLQLIETLENLKLQGFVIENEMLQNSSIPRINFNILKVIIGHITIFKIIPIIIIVMKNRFKTVLRYVSISSRYTLTQLYNSDNPPFLKLKNRYVHPLIKGISLKDPLRERFFILTPRCHACCGLLFLFFICTSR